MSAKDRQAIRDLIKRRMAEMEIIGPTARRHLARARLINDGTHYRGRDGKLHLHPNYGGKSGC